MIACTKCSTPLTAKNLNIGTFAPCRICGTQHRISVFPAALRKTPSHKNAELLLVNDDAGCFYHSKKKAVTHCSSCGRFLCALCDVEIDGEHICFPCMEKGKKKNELTNLENQRTLFDDIALKLAIFPMLIFWFTCITAPISLFMVFRYWNVPTSIVRRSKVRFVVAFIISAAQVIGWCVGIFMLVG